MGQPNPPFPPGPAQGQSPVWSFPYAQPAQPANVPTSVPAGPTDSEKLDQLLAQHADLRNQVAELTAATNGLGQNTQALHEWVVGQVEQIGGMISGITQAVRTEGIQGILKNLFTGGPPSAG